MGNRSRTTEVNIVFGNIKPRIYERYRTIGDFAREAGIGENRVSKIITGRVQPKPEEIRIISEKLEIDRLEISPE
jgi:hypothetical protein